MRSNLFIRLDDRLVHGQVTQGWVPYFKSKNIIVVNEEILNDPFQKKIISLAVPMGVSITFTSNEQLPKIVENLKEHSIVLYNDLEYLLNYTAGNHVSDVNLSNYHPKESIKIEKNFWVTEKELKLLLKTINGDTRYYIQMVPTDNPIDLREILKKWQKN